MPPASRLQPPDTPAGLGVLQWAFVPWLLQARRTSTAGLLTDLAQMMHLALHAVGATTMVCAPGVVACVECLQQTGSGRAAGLAVRFVCSASNFSCVAKRLLDVRLLFTAAKATRRRAGWL